MNIISFKNVHFTYPGDDQERLCGIDLDIAAGSFVAVLGHNGSGKSTLAKHMNAILVPDEGQVLIDGRDARERSQLWLHSNIGYVLQTPHLFSGTVRENLLYGNQNATDEDIRRALELVSAQGVVDKLENGLETDVGEGGDMLSTGEKQLLSFARAILADPRILVLDEATASVDTITEQKIQSAIDTIIRGRTSVVIAHRLSTVRNAQAILVLEQGEIIERGDHEDLLKQKGRYYQLYTGQSELS